MLKWLINIAIISYLLVYYGQNIFEKSYFVHSAECSHSEDVESLDCKIVQTPRVMFYFISNAIIMLIISIFVYYKSESFITGGFVFWCIGDIISKVFDNADITLKGFIFLAIGFTIYCIEKAIRKNFEH